MTDIHVELAELHPMQQEIVDHPARFKVVSCGRRFGKTFLSQDVLIWACINSRKPYSYTAPTYKGMRVVWETFRDGFYNIIADVNEQERRLTFITGATLEFWSLDSPDAMRGRAYAGIVVDEAASVPRLEYAWNEVIRATLTDYKGWALFLSTPRGMDYFHSLYVNGLDETRPDWMCWTAPTVTNPYIDPQEVEDAKLELPERSFAQEYLAEFLDDGGAVFSGVKDVCRGQRKPAQKGHEYVVGVDWGKVDDFSVFSVFDVNTLEQVEMLRIRQASWSLQREKLKALCDTYQARLVLAESNSIGEPNIEILKNEMGLPVEGFNTNIKTKAPLIDNLAASIERKEVKLLQDDILIHELLGYTANRLPSGSYQYGAPPGGHDDTVIATALGLAAAKRPKRIARILRRSLYG